MLKPVNSFFFFLALCQFSAHLSHIPCELLWSLYYMLKLNDETQKSLLGSWTIELFLGWFLVRMELLRAYFCQRRYFILLYLKSTILMLFSLSGKWEPNATSNMYLDWNHCLCHFNCYVTSNNHYCSWYGLKSLSLHSVRVSCIFWFYCLTCWWIYSSPSKIPRHDQITRYL